MHKTIKLTNRRPVACVTVSEGHILELFFKNKVDIDHEQMLKKVLKQIEEEHGLKPSDDITMIRWIDI